MSSGCPGPGDLLHGSAVVSKDRSLASFSCGAGFSLSGSALLYCKGKNWNSTKPVCKVADIMSVLHLNQEFLHGPAHVPTGLKNHLQSHLNTMAITAHKDAFLKSALLEVPHMTIDSKKPSKSLMFASEPIKNPENIKDPIRSSDLQKPVPVTSNVNTMSLASSFNNLILTTASSSFNTPSVDPQQVKIMHQMFTETPYRRNENRYQFTLSTDTTSVTTSAEVLLEYIKNKPSTTLAPNINTLGTNDYLQSGSLINEHPATFISPTARYPRFIVSENESVNYLKPSAPSTCRGLCEQDVQKTSPSTNPIGPASSSMEITEIATDLPPVDVHRFIDNAEDQQVNDKSNQSDLKLTFEPLEDVPDFPTRKRPVCPYPPFPSHGTFYFRSIKNPGPLQYKHYIQYACYPGYTLTNGDVYSYCQHDGQWSGQTPLCLELTPCTLQNGGCSQICRVNEHHSAQCVCKLGFLLLEDQRTCRDLDECVEELHLCQQACENTLGSYRCSCSPGFQLSADGTSCSDVDECQLVGRALCEFGCINTPGSFQCLCPEGHQLDSTNRHCIDINECEDTDVIQQEQLQHMCEWKCVNLPGTYKCICPRGYRLHSNRHQCEDINECELKNGGCSHLCINHRGGYKCACPEKHRISPYNTKNCLPVERDT
ncbi:latent-transforming growth factor beta-binding protein 3 isoform X2 [Danio aesculapii]|uniref:latent-transforming growth factor beta-binding protein 3 isoform X2 n=1 Tax=Danio aesculapii TaxID=1142201 RepID=UPI0024C04E4C|nr:latent-transforming growth factor beta-binding protein 3 isoform X2 [Danio aesculapii]